MRKFTTQILSLLTALSFAGALSAQTVEDAIATADNATGGDKLGLTVEGYFMYGLIGGSGAANYKGLVAEDLCCQNHSNAKLSVLWSNCNWWWFKHWLPNCRRFRRSSWC